MNHKSVTTKNPRLRLRLCRGPKPRRSLEMVYTTANAFFWSGGHFVHNEAFSIQSSCFFFTFSDAFQSGELSTQRPSRGSRSSVVWSGRALLLPRLFLVACSNFLCQAGRVERDARRRMHARHSMCEAKMAFTLNSSAKMMNLWDWWNFDEKNVGVISGNACKSLQNISSGFSDVFSDLWWVSVNYHDIPIRLWNTRMREWLKMFLGSSKFLQTFEN